MSNNRLKSLPINIGKLANLVYLGLNRNKIEELPVSIGDLEKLEVLEMWDNELYTIPDEISNLRNLKVVELRGILFSEEEAQRIDSLLSHAKVHMSPPCNCSFY
jgi:Leucine-rich repeat (LRR) protein